MKRKTKKKSILPGKWAIFEQGLDLLRKKHRHITVTTVVADASSKRHPLHRHFQWNDAKAAHEHRLATARQLFRSWFTEVKRVRAKQRAQAF